MFMSMSFFLREEQGVYSYVYSHMPNIILPDQFNVTTAFLDRNLTEGRGGKIAIYHEDQSYTYTQIAELANQVGNGLLELGIEIEQRVALLLLDSPQFAATFFGAIKIGAVPVPLNTMHAPMTISIC